MKNHLVVALAYDQLCTFEFGCVIEIFALPRPELNVDWYRFAICAAERKPIRAMGGLTIGAPGGLGLLDSADTIIVPGWRSTDEIPPDAVLKKIRRANERGARLASICSGVFVLAAAGVLSGRTVTTHWRYADKLAGRYPDVRVRANAIYVDDGQIITSAGSAAGLDMLLHLIRSDHGAKVANLVARRLVIPPHRQGDQAQYVPRPVAREESGRLASLLDWIRRHLGQPHTLRSLAARAAISTRTLHRQFFEATGMAPYDWILRERVALATELLESRTLHLGRVAELCGFHTEQSLRRHFRRVTGTSPSAFRLQFAGDPRSLQVRHTAAATPASFTDREPGGSPDRRHASSSRHRSRDARRADLPASRSRTHRD
jgi:AraC family transcriptional regulator, transcriptional activator FtrA